MVGICICAYNEEKNIGHLLERLCQEKSLDEVVVVASGCTDKTVEIARQFEPRVKVLIQEEREGKASAINLFLKHTKAEIIVLESADTLPKEGSINKLISPLLSYLEVGIVGSRPIPVNSNKTAIGYAVNMMWELHHFISLHNPKMGEAIAFRRTFERIPPSTLVDEASIEILIKAQGYKPHYEPDAIFINKGPETLRDFIKQRKRVYMGHLSLKAEFGFRVATLSSTSILRVMWGHGYFRNHPIRTITTMGLEAYCRFLAWVEFTFRHPTKGIWEMVESSKDLIKSGVEDLEK